MYNSSFKCPIFLRNLCHKPFYFFLLLMTHGFVCGENKFGTHFRVETLMERAGEVGRRPHLCSWCLHWERVPPGHVGAHPWGCWWSDEDVSFCLSDDLTPSLGTFRRQTAWWWRGREAGGGHLFGEQLCLTDSGVLWARQSREVPRTSALIGLWLDRALATVSSSDAPRSWKR